MNRDSKSLEGRVVLITGGTGGIGRALARQMAQDGAKVVVVGRNQSIGTKLVETITGQGGQAEFMAADLSLISQVNRLAQDFRAKYERLDILIQAADILVSKRINTSEGFEAAFATNYLGRFLLVYRLLDLIKASTPSQIVHIAAAGIPGKLNLSQLPPTPTLGALTSHNQGQLANDYFGVELAQRLAGTQVGVKIFNPGLVDTGIRKGSRLMALSEIILKPLIKSPDDFARIVLNVITSAPTNAPDKILFNSKGQTLKLAEKLNDTHTRQQLWTISEQLTTA